MEINLDDPIDLLREGVIAIPGTDFKFNYIAGALGFVIGGGDLISGGVAGVVTPLALPPSEDADSDVVDSDGTVIGGGGDGSTEPPVDDPIDGGGDVPPPVLKTAKQLLTESAGSWSESANGPYIEVTTSDRFVSFKAVGQGSKEVMSFSEVQARCPNNVRFIGMTKTVLSIETNITFGLDVLSLMVNGHSGIEGYATGFYLATALNRDAAVRGFPSLANASSYVDVDSFYARFESAGSPLSVVTDTRDVGVPGESWEVVKRSRAYTVSFGSSGDSNGVVSGLNTVGDIVREMVSSSAFYSSQDSDLTYAPANGWGKAPNRYTIPVATHSVILASLKLALSDASLDNSFDSLEELALHYVDNPSVRENWDNCSHNGNVVTVVKYYHNSIAPFQSQGQQRF
jgi:hypothetical protein